MAVGITIMWLILLFVVLLCLFEFEMIIGSDETMWEFMGLVFVWLVLDLLVVHFVMITFYLTMDYLEATFWIQKAKDMNIFLDSTTPLPVSGFKSTGYKQGDSADCSS